MADQTRSYAIDYKADTEAARGQIESLRKAVSTLDAAVDSSADAMHQLDAEAKKSGGTLAAVANALAKMKGIDLSNINASGVVAANLAVVQLADNLVDVRHSAEGAIGGLEKLSEARAGLGGVAQSVGNLANNAARANVEVGQVAARIGAIGGQGRAALSGASDAMQGLQRKAYGAKMNVVELNSALARTAEAGAAIGPTTEAVGRLGIKAGEARGNLRAVAASARSLARGITAVAGGISAVDAIRGVARAGGDAINEARDSTKTGSERAAAMRDHYREVANLQGKDAPDDETVVKALRLRMASGMDDRSADAFLRKYYGSIEAGKQKGNIAEDVAADVQAIAATLGTRTGMSEGTAGDLAASLSNYGEVGSGKSAAGQLGSIVRQLNAGRGDLTPLTESLIRTAGSTVGKGLPFADLPELAAAIGVASNNASPAAAGTMIRQAQRALTGFGKRQGPALEQAGIKSGDRFLEMIDKIAPLVEDAEKMGLNPDAELQSAGFGNITDRTAIATMVRQRGLLRTRIGEVKGEAGVDGTYTESGARVIDSNRAFLSSDVAQDRVSRAAEDAAEYGRYAPGARVETERRFAEARLKAAGMLDTPRHNFLQSFGDGFGVMPMIGFPKVRNQMIDEEARRFDMFRPSEKQAGRTDDLLQGLLDEARKANEHRRGRDPFPYAPFPRVEPIR